MVKYKKKDELLMIKYLRFRSKNPGLSKKTYMKHKDIAKLLNKSTSYV